jgi:hypothetical protein
MRKKGKEIAVAYQLNHQHHNRLQNARAKRNKMYLYFKAADPWELLVAECSRHLQKKIVSKCRHFYVYSYCSHTE